MQRFSESHLLQVAGRVLVLLLLHHGRLQHRRWPKVLAVLVRRQPVLQRRVCTLTGDVCISNSIRLESMKV